MTDIKNKGPEMKMRFLERLWRSNDVRDMITFFEHFNEIGDLISFSSSRPKAPIAMKKVNFQTLDKNRISFDNIIVVPTLDSSGPLATEFASSFSTYPIIFVESGGEFFNYSYSVNSGVTEALDYSPERIIISNDDVLPLRPCGALNTIVNSQEDVDVLIPANKESRYHGEEAYFLRHDPLFSLTQFVWALRNLRGISNKLGSLFLLYHLKQLKVVPYIPHDRLRKAMLAFGMFRTMASPLLNFADFGIFRADVLRVNRFDENFINGVEDYDMMMRLKKAGYTAKRIGFEIKSIGGATFGNRSNTRFFHDIFNSIYFSMKHFGDQTSSQTGIQSDLP